MAKNWWEDESAYARPFWQDEDAYAVHRPEEPGLLDELRAKIKSGLGVGVDRAQGAIGRLLPDLASDEAMATEERVARGLGYANRADHQRAMEAQRIAQSEREFQTADVTHPDTARGLQEIADAEGPWEATKAVATNPRAVATTTAQSLGMIAPGMLAATATGPAAPAVVGGNSAAIEYESTILDTLSEAGIDTTDAAQVRRALDDPALMAQAKDRAGKRGLAIGLFDAATAGIAGRIVAGARGSASTIARTGGETGAQLGGGMAGEATAQLATEGRVDQWGDVVMEGIAEVPTTITEVPTNYRRAREAFREREQTEATVQGDYTDLASAFGATITSRKRTPEHNRRVGGVANSQHLRGTAGDFVVPAEQKAAFKAEARSRGYEVHDEGDHIHLELPRGAAGRATAQTRRQARAEAVANPQNPGASAVADALEAARKKRGMSVERREEPESSASSTTSAAPTPDPLAAANDPSLPPAERRAAKSAFQKRVAGPIDALKDQLLDQLTAGSLDAKPSSVPDIPATQPAPVSTPAPSTANQPATPVAAPAPQAPQEGLQQAPAPSAPVATPQPPAPAPASQAQPEPEPWQVIAKTNTAGSQGLELLFNGDPTLRSKLMGSNQPLPEGAVTEVTLAPAQQASLKLLGRVLGRELMLIDIKAPGGSTLGGMAVDSKHIFINVNAVRNRGLSMTGVIGHEFTHTLRTAGSKPLEELVEFAGRHVNQSNSYAMKRLVGYFNHYSKYAGISENDALDMAVEELVADYLGDLLSDPVFWAELYEDNPSLFRRLIKRLVDFLTKIRDRARQLGHPEAFHEAERMRQMAVAVMREHLGRVASGDVAAEPNKVRGANGMPKPIMPELEEGEVKYSRADLVRDRGTKLAASHFESGRYMDAAREAAQISDEYAPPMDIETPEQRKFFEGSRGTVNKADKAGVYFHGTARDITRFKPHTGEAVFLAERSSFSGPYAAQGFSKQQQMGQFDVVVDGVAMNEVKKQHRLGSVDYTFAELMQYAGGDINKAFDLLPDYHYYNEFGDPLTLDDETNDKVAEMLQGLSFLFEDNPGIIQTRQRTDYAGMQIIPLVTNAKKAWDYRNSSDVKKLVEALRDKHGTLANMRGRMHMKHGFEDWDHVARALSNKYSNWTLMEDLGAGIPQLLREMGYDAYHVTEEGHTNLAVFDPRQIKSPFNAGPWGVRPPTAEEAAGLGMTLEEAVAAQQEGHIMLMSLGTLTSQTFTNGLYNRSNVEQLERWFHDEFRDLREVQKDIARQHFGGRLPQGLDAHRYENLRHGAYQDARQRAEDRFIRPIAKVLSKAGLDLDGFSDYLWWRHAPERDAYLRSHLDPTIAANIGPDELAGISPADAQASIAALDPATRAAYERAAKFIDGMRKFTLDRLVQSGQITVDHYNNVLAQYAHYVPFRGMPDGSEVANGGQGRGLNMQSKPLGKRAAGRKSKPDNIIEEMMRDMDLALIGEQKQTVLDALAKLIVTHPDPDLWEIAPVAAERKWVNGVLTVVQTNGEPKDQITFMHRGIPVKIEIRHEGMRKALLNMQEPFPKLLRSTARLTRWLSAVKTSFSPFFLLINPVRDAGLASMAVLAEHDMATMKAVAKFYPHTYDALRADDQHLKVSPSANPVVRKLQQYAREFSSVGGKTGYTYVNDIREQQKKLSHLIARHSKSKGMKDIVAGNFGTKDAGLLARKAFQHVAHAFEVVNDMAENSTRLAVYAALRDQGKSVEDAAAYAKEVTVNFNRRGSASKIIGGFYMFFNAAMQGGIRFSKLTLGNKRFAGMMGGMFAASYAMALGQMFAAGDDDDGESNYDKAISDAQAQRSIGIYLGGGKSLVLPVPYGPNIFTYAGYRLAKLHYQTARGKNPSIGSATGDIVSQALMSMSPLDPGRGWSALLPEIFRIPIQAGQNRNDFGGKLNPKLQGTREEALMPRVDKTSVTTGAPYRWAAAALNEMSGGTKYTPGKVNITGEQARYVAEQYGGGMLRLATESWELAENMLSGIDPEPSDIPLLNVYYRGRGEMRHAASYYENTEDYERSVAQWQKAIAEDDQDAIERILKKAPWIEGAELSAGTREGREAQVGTVMEAKRDTDRAISALRKEQRAVLADKELGWRERKRLAREIDLEIAQYQKDFNASMNAGRRQ